MGKWTEEHHKQTDAIVSLLSGALAGVVVKTTTAPLERVKILFQLQGMKGEGATEYRGIMQTLSYVSKNHGVRALWKGNGANVVRVMPVYAFKFGFNDQIKDFFRTNPGDKLNFTELILSGSTAGLIQTTLTYPLDLVRTRLSLSESLNIKYKGIFDCAVQTVRQEGITALYKGFGPTLASATPYVGLQMTFFEMLSRVVKKPDESPTMEVLTTLFCGAAGGVAAQTLTFPGDTIRRRMQIQGIGGAKERLYKNTFDCIKKIWRLEGWQGYFKGWTANTARGIPGAGIQFLAFTQIKEILTTMAYRGDDDEDDDDNDEDHDAAAAAAFPAGAAPPAPPSDDEE